MHVKKKYKKKWWAGTLPLFIFVAAGIYVMDSAGITKNTILDAISQAVQSNLGYQAVRSCMPVLAYDAASSGQKTIYEYLADSMD